VLGDALRLEQVLVNLLRNGLDAMADSERRRLSVELAAADGAAEVRVSDTGHGIDAAHLDQLFDPFFTTKDVGEWVGLGLTISYGIVADMGGSIRAANNADGGATFTLRLPLAAETPGPGDET